MPSPKFAAFAAFSMRGLAMVLLLTITIGLLILGYAGVHNSKVNCQEIEKVKTRIRVRAIEDEARLPQNAKLLGIKLTPALIKAEKKALARTLRDYAPGSCNGFFSNNNG